LYRCWGVVERISEVVADVTGYSPVKLADLVIMLVKDLLRRWRKRGLLF
jgi:lactate dehydrogenase-like 2-hydroxyacid dehydrogenase